MAALSACGGKHEESSGPGIAMSAAPEKIASTVCPKAYGCCTAMQLMDNGQAGTDVASCQEKTRQGFANHFAAVRTAEAQGRAHYRGDRVAECVAFIQASSCETLATTNHFTGVKGCDALVEPMLGAGAVCANDWECIDGTCQKAMGAAEGTCQPRVQAGQPCEHASCVANAVCGGAGTCVALAPEGSLCTDPLQCQSLNCSATPGSSGTCLPPKADKCFYSSACSYGGRPSGLALLALAALIWTRRHARAGRPPRR
jgi:hypothetical protein